MITVFNFHCIYLLWKKRVRFHLNTPLFLLWFIFANTSPPLVWIFNNFTIGYKTIYKFGVIRYVGGGFSSVLSAFSVVLRIYWTHCILMMVLWYTYFRAASKMHHCEQCFHKCFANKRIPCFNYNLVTL